MIKKESLNLSILTVLYIFTRLTNLTLLPIHGDEAVYIRWAQLVADSPASNLFVPYIDGKAPLFMWLNAFLTFNLFDDPLFSARIISVAAGLLSISGVFLIGTLLYSAEVGILASLLYIFSPYEIFHDRMALLDGLLNMFSILSLLFFILFLKRGLSMKICAIGLGLAMGLGFLTKTPALLFIMLPAVFVILLYFRTLSNWKLLLSSYLVSGTAVLPVLIYYKKSIGWGGIKITPNDPFFMKFNVLLSLPFNKWSVNVWTVGAYFRDYFTIPILILLTFSLLRLIFTREKEDIILAGWLLIPSGLIILLINNFYSRYFLFAASAGLILAAKTIVLLKNSIKNKFGDYYRHFYKIIIIGLFLVIFFPSLRFTYALLSNPVNAPFHPQDRYQYINGSWAGYGIPKLMEFLKDEAKDKKITVLVTTNWGNPSDAIFVYLNRIPSIRIYEAWWWTKMPLIPAGPMYIKLVKSKFQYQEIGILNFESLKKGDVYFVCESGAFSGDSFKIINPNFNLIKSFSALGTHSIDVYKFIP